MSSISLFMPLKNMLNFGLDVFEGYRLAMKKSEQNQGFQDFYSLEDGLEDFNHLNHLNYTEDFKCSKHSELALLKKNIDKNIDENINQEIKKTLDLNKINPKLKNPSENPSEVFSETSLMNSNKCPNEFPNKFFNKNNTYNNNYNNAYNNNYKNNDDCNVTKITNPKNQDKLEIVARLLRINHTGEICAQALYQAQMRYAKNPAVYTFLKHAKVEEELHLGWCYQGLKDLNARASYLNIFWYGASYLIAAFLAKQSDERSLGFVYHTEAQVEEHLGEHIQILENFLEKILEKNVKNSENNNLNSKDVLKTLEIKKSLEVLDMLQQMQIDEALHGQQALALGGIKFNLFEQNAMRALAKVMTFSTYYI